MESSDRWPSQILPQLFGSVMGANVLAMSLMNVAEAETRFLPLVYLVCLVLMAILLSRSRISYPTLSRREHVLAIALACIFFLPRIPYLFEHALGYAILPTGDDAFHIPNFASIIHTTRFPSRSTYDSSQYLAYYYAAWIPGAAIYYTGIISTVMQALVLTKLLYSFFIAYFPLYAARVLFSSVRERTIFIVLVYLYGGFDFLWWVSHSAPIPVHSEWWANNFGFLLQFSNFVTLSLWTPQHLLAALSIVFAMHVLASSRGAISAALAGILFASAVFSSPFTTLGAIPLVAWFFLKFRRFAALPMCGFAFSLVSLPLWWILLGNDSVGFTAFGALQGYWVNHKAMAFPVFLLVIALELGPLLAAAAIAVKRFPKAESGWLFAISSLFLLSTFFMFYSENYSMRGSIVPIFTLMYLSTPVLLDWYQRYHHRLLQVAVATYFLGGILEYASFNRMTWWLLQNSNTPFNAAALRSNSDESSLVPADLVEESKRYMGGWQLLEKNKAGRKYALSIEEARQMHPDNCYRITFGKRPPSCME